MFWLTLFLLPHFSHVFHLFICFSYERRPSHKSTATTENISAENILASTAGENNLRLRSDSLLSSENNKWTKKICLFWPPVNTVCTCVLTEMLIIHEIDKQGTSPRDVFKASISEKTPHIFLAITTLSRGIGKGTLVSNLRTPTHCETRLEISRKSSVRFCSAHILSVSPH